MKHENTFTHTNISKKTVIEVIMKKSNIYVTRIPHLVI